ncbi:MAG TPA: OmpA family protein, partial [Candidatus Limnocylindrales bacterium]|nr:OmpA family protein [Candidatus Limnocylindrales bacterium]
KERKIMSTDRIVKFAFVVSLSLAALALLCGVAGAQSAQLQGVINGRSGATMTVQSQDLGNVVVLLTDNTQVEDVSGLFHARKKQMGMTALVPGLQVQVKGSYNAQNQLVADTVKFNGKNLQTATDIQAGVTPVEQQEQAQKAQAAKQEAQIQKQEQAMTQQQQEMAAAQAKIAANKAAIAAVNKRFGELDDYNIWDEVTVLFGNGQVAVDPQYKPKLLALCQKAKTVTGYVIQVKGYASAVGSAALNQKLSQERAANVTDFLDQQCHIPLTNVLAPGAMGTSKQVAPDNTAEGQAENRRVVVRVLQNKGIAGT